MSADADARARIVMARCDALAAYTDEPGRLTRAYGTPALRAAQDQVAVWMAEAGMTVRRDAVGNLIGRCEGGSGATRTMLLGSHLDTVRDAGRYDGALGVLVAIAAVADLHERGPLLPFAVEVTAFADEEGLRFHSTYLGSRALAGTLDETTLALVDADGVLLADAIRAFGGDPSPEALAAARRDAAELLGYAEVHIEQGPVLEGMGLPVGVVTAITSQTRAMLSFTGMAGHAGTVPMEHRRDALSAAAELILLAEQTARAQPGLVATIGQITAEPGASNVIPGRAVFSLDLRHPDNGVRVAARDHLRRQADEIAARRGVTVDWRNAQETAAVACDPALTGVLARAIEAAGYPVHRLPSGAGHDAVALSPITPTAMLFVRCAGGISHNPAESVMVADVAVAIGVIDRFLQLLAPASGDS